VPQITTHCGVGSPEEYRDYARVAGEAGFQILKKGGSALDAVEAAVVIMEDDDHLNAGTGSRMRLNGKIQMDAALMDSELRSGAVAAIEFVRNPIRVARKVMETPHLLLVGEDATAFARHRGFRLYNPATSAAKAHLEEALRALRKKDLPPQAKSWANFAWKDTVGAVAMDKKGGYAVACSTGGTQFMLPGRVGDTPIVGAGLYAGPKGGVTATGIGEEIIRRVLSKAVYDWIAQGKSPQSAVQAGVDLYPEEVPIGLVALSKGKVGVAANRTMASWNSSVPLLPPKKPSVPLTSPKKRSVHSTTPKKRR